MAALRFIFTDRLSQLLRFVSIFAYITYVTPLDLLLGAFTPAHGYHFNSMAALSFFTPEMLPVQFSGLTKPTVLTFQQNGFF